MDLSLLWIAILMLIAGAVLSIIGEALKPRPAADADQPPSFSEIIRRALGLLLTAVGQIVNAPSNGHRIQGLGSALAVLSVFVLIAWLLIEVLPEVSSQDNDNPSPSPST